ncbi:MAG: C-terminal helicase domain-containing protein, partial [Mariprofundaceae bacterium]|nr:C-terminal helicase domain-containing protein [Mariprofundaceae bacterium]
ICRAFDIAPECAIRTGFYRSNLTMLTTPVSVHTRDEILQQRLQTQAHGPTIIYVTLQRTAELVAEQLCKIGFSARAYHAGLKDELRAATQEWFMASDSAIVVATIAFGMGVDKSNIRYVYHYNLPKSLENYAQEVGRAGRDGLASVCEMLVCVDDLNVLENFIYGDTPTQSSLQSLVQAVFTQGDDFDVSLYELSIQHDIRPLVLRTLLTYLELEAYLQGGTAFYADYSFKPLLSSQEILSHFEGERHTFLRSIFLQAKKAKTWFNIDMEQAAQQLGSSRERIIRALDYLADQNMLAVKVSGVRNPYRLIKAPDDLMALADHLHQRALKREQSEISRLQQVLDLVGLEGCQVNALATHFDDPRQTPCGHCSWCLHQTAAKSLVRIEPQINHEIWTQALKLRKEKAALHDVVSLVRFLCGVTSPQLTRAKLSRHVLFGALADIPFQTLIKHANQVQNL